MILWLLACSPSDTKEDTSSTGDTGDTADTGADLAPIETAAIDYATVCADEWSEETCATEPCDLDPTALAYEEAWRAWVQPRWALADVDYAERVDLWRADWRDPDERLELAHLVSMSWHRALLSYAGPAAGPDPTADDALAYWESYEPAHDLSFTQPLAPYADVIAAAQACADEIGAPLLPTGLCHSRLGEADDGATHLMATFYTEPAGAVRGYVDVDLSTAQGGTCWHEDMEGE